MYSRETILTVLKFYLKAKGFTDQKLHTTGQPGAFIQEMRKSIDAGTEQEIPVIDITHAIDGTFLKGKYTMTFEFDFKFNTKTGDLILSKVTASEFRGTEISYPIYKNDWTRLPKIHDLVDDIRVKEQKLIRKQFHHFNERKNKNKPNR